MRADLARAPLLFAPADGVAWSERRGWRVAEVHDAVHESIRLRRAPSYLRPFGLLLQPDARQLGNAPSYGIVRLERAA